MFIQILKNLLLSHVLKNDCSGPATAVANTGHAVFAPVLTQHRHEAQNNPRPRHPIEFFRRKNCEFTQLDGLMPQLHR
jgi:hypothetical protein